MDLESSPEELVNWISVLFSETSEAGVEYFMPRWLLVVLCLLFLGAIGVGLWIVGRIL